MTNTSRDPGALSGPLAGAAAVGSLVTSALHSLAFTVDGTGKATVLTPHCGVFLAGGPVHSASFGIFTGCLSLAGHRTRCLPELLATAGLIAAVAGMLSPLSLIIGPAMRLLPAARTSVLVVTEVAGLLLGRSGQARRESP
jgi:hypothetical protein